MRVFIAPPNSFVYKSVMDIKIGIDHISAINNNRMCFSGKGPDMFRIQVFVLMMPGKDNNSIRTFHRIIKVLEDRNTGILLYIGIMNVYRCT